MSKKKDIEIEGYIPYMLGGALIGAVALNYLSNNHHHHLSFATTNTSTENEHPVHHHSSSSSHPTHHHTTTHPAHRSSSPLFQEEGAHRPHSPRHTTSSSPAHHNHEHATFLHTHPNHANDDDGFGFHRAEGFGGGFGGGGRGGGGGGAGFGGHGGFGGMGGGFGGHGGPHGGGGGEGMGGFGGPHGGFGHNHSEGHGEGHNRHQRSGGHHNRGQITDNNTGSQHHGGGNQHNVGHQGRHHGKGSKGPNGMGPKLGGRDIDVNASHVTPASQLTKDDLAPSKATIEHKKSTKKELGEPVNPPLLSGAATKSNQAYGKAFTGLSLDTTGNKFALDGEENNGHPSNRMVVYHPFKNFESTAYASIGKVKDPNAYIMMETGGPPQSNKDPNCCNYAVGLRASGKVYMKEESDHTQFAHGDDGDISKWDTSKPYFINDKIPPLKDGQKIGLKTVLLRGLKGSDPKNPANDTRLISWANLNGDGKTWTKLLDLYNPSAVGRNSGKDFPVITNTSNRLEDGKQSKSMAQEMRVRIENMANDDKKKTNDVYPALTEIHEIDPNKLDGAGNYIGGNKPVTLPPVPPNHPKSAPHGITTGNIGSGNIVGSTGRHNTSPLSTSHINAPSSGGYHGPPIHITAAGGGGIGAAGVGDLLSNIHNTPHGSGIRPPTPTTPRRVHDLGAGTADFYNQVSRDISRTPTPIRQHHTATGDFYNFMRDEIEGQSNPNTSRLPSITGDFYNHVNDEISHMPYPRHPTNTEDSYTYFDPDTGRVLGISNTPLTDTELYSNLAKSDDNKSTTTDLIAMGALIGVPLVLLMAFL